MDPALTFSIRPVLGRIAMKHQNESAREGAKMDIATLGIDLAKNLFQVPGVDGKGRTGVQRQLGRRQLLPFVAQLEPCLVAMEACGGAHYWAREIARRGHEVRLMSPRFVRPYVKSNKNDARDAEAICEAVGRPSMRFVAGSNSTTSTNQSLDYRTIQRIERNPRACARFACACGPREASWAQIGQMSRILSAHDFLCPTHAIGDVPIGGSIGPKSPL